jgi:hypothetical protein
MPVNYERYRTEWAELKYAYSRAWGSKQSVIPAQILGTTPRGLGTYQGTASKYSLASLANELFSLRMQMDLAKMKLPMSLNALANILARADQRYSMQMSAGPVDPREQNPKAAWKIPVRRITGDYFQHWFVRRMAPGVWIVYNPTREAYYIEFGIHTSGRRVRRPVRKLALIKTLKFADRQKVGQLVWEGIFGHIRQAAGTGRGSLIVHDMPQSPAVMRVL